MNKNGETNIFSYIVPIILVLTVLLLIYNFSTSAPLNLGKSFLNALGLGEEVDFAKQNEVAKNGFNDFIKVLRQCSDYKDTECVCNAPLTSFFRTHLITITKNEIKVEIVKDKNKITMSKENVENGACYMAEDSVSAMNLEIAFDNKGAYIPDTGPLGTDFFGHTRILTTDNIYKIKGNLCFITNDFKEKVKKCSK